MEQTAREIKVRHGHKDEDAPLFRIREKEMEISGRVLQAKKEAEKIVADARRKATDIVSKAQEDADKLAKEHEAKRLAEAQKEAEGIRANVGAELKPIEEMVKKRRDDAIKAVTSMVTSV